MLEPVAVPEVDSEIAAERARLVQLQEADADVTKFSFTLGDGRVVEVALDATLPWWVGGFMVHDKIDVLRRHLGLSTRLTVFDRLVRRRRRRERRAADERAAAAAAATAAAREERAERRRRREELQSAFDAAREIWTSAQTAGAEDEDELAAAGEEPTPPEELLALNEGAEADDAASEAAAAEAQAAAEEVDEEERAEGGSLGGLDSGDDDDATSDHQPPLPPPEEIPPWPFTQATVASLPSPSKPPTADGGGDDADEAREGGGGGEDDEGPVDTTLLFALEPAAAAPAAPPAGGSAAARGGDGQGGIRMVLRLLPDPTPALDDEAGGAGGAAGGTDGDGGSDGADRRASRDGGGDVFEEPAGPDVVAAGGAVLDAVGLALLCGAERAAALFLASIAVAAGVSPPPPPGSESAASGGGGGGGFGGASEAGRTSVAGAGVRLPLSPWAAAAVEVTATAAPHGGGGGGVALRTLAAAHARARPTAPIGVPVGSLCGGPGVAGLGGGWGLAEAAAFIDAAVMPLAAGGVVAPLLRCGTAAGDTVGTPAGCAAVARLLTRCLALPPPAGGAGGDEGGAGGDDASGSGGDGASATTSQQLGRGDPDAGIYAAAAVAAAVESGEAAAASVLRWVPLAAGVPPFVLAALAPPSPTPPADGASEAATTAGVGVAERDWVVGLVEVAAGGYARAMPVVWSDIVALAVATAAASPRGTALLTALLAARAAPQPGGGGVGETALWALLLSPPLLAIAPPAAVGAAVSAGVAAGAFGPAGSASLRDVVAAVPPAAAAELTLRCFPLLVSLGVAPPAAAAAQFEALKKASAAILAAARGGGGASEIAAALALAGGVGLERAAVVAVVCDDVAVGTAVAADNAAALVALLKAGAPIAARLEGDAKAEFLPAFAAKRGAAACVAALAKLARGGGAASWGRWDGGAALAETRVGQEGGLRAMSRAAEDACRWDLSPDGTACGARVVWAAGTLRAA